MSIITSFNNQYILVINHLIYSNKIKELDIFVKNLNIDSLLNNNQSPLEHPLYNAVKTGSVEAVKILLDKGADPDVYSNLQGETSLHRAAKVGNIALLSVLLKGGANPNSLDKNGSTPQMNTLIYQQVKASRFFNNYQTQFNDYWQQLIMLNHRFGLEEEIQINQKNFGLSGFYLEISSKFLEESFCAFIKETKSSNLKISAESNQILDTVLESLSFAVKCSQTIKNSHFINEILKRVQSNKAVAIYTGWDHHCTAAVISRNKFIKCNRGGGVTSVAESGSTIYSIYQKNNIKKVCVKLIENHEKPSNRDFFLKEVDDLLLLHNNSNSVHLHHSLQKSDTCSWASLKTALRALMWAALRENTGDEAYASTESYKLYKTWSEWDRKYGIKEFLKVSENINYVGKKEILQAIYNKSLMSQGPSGKLNNKIKKQLKALI